MFDDGMYVDCAGAGASERILVDLLTRNLYVSSPELDTKPLTHIHLLVDHSP